MDSDKSEMEVMIIVAENRKQEWYDGCQRE